MGGRAAINKNVTDKKTDRTFLLYLYHKVLSAISKPGGMPSPLGRTHRPNHPHLPQRDPVQVGTLCKKYTLLNALCQKLSQFFFDKTEASALEILLYSINASHCSVLNPREMQEKYDAVSKMVQLEVSNMTGEACSHVISFGQNQFHFLLTDQRVMLTFTFLSSRMSGTVLLP